MAKFVLVSKNGRTEVEIEGALGEELSPDQVNAYYMMLAADSLAKIAARYEAGDEPVC